MARILYGVSGEGSGHSSRAREMIPFLLDEGHEVKVATYDRGIADLAEHFDTIEIEGLHIATADNRVRVVETFMHNLGKLPEGLESLRRLRKLFATFRPDVVITDFEPMSAYLADRGDLPLITIDNQHRIRYMRYPCPRRLKKDSLLTETVVRAMVPRPDVSLVTTFYFGEVKNERTFLFPPILRREIFELQAREEAVFIVYHTQGFESFNEMLRSFPQWTFLIYGWGEERVDANLHYRAFDRVAFLDDLARCAGVMATAGFTLMTEALHLGKPYLALPMRGQFEQHLNALLLDQLGYGKELTDPSVEAIAAFIDDLPRYRARLAEYERGETDNLGIKQRLARLLADDCREARAFHRRRRGKAPTR